MRESLTSTAFIKEKQEFLNKIYTSSAHSVDEAVHDAEKLLSDLHISSCKIKRVNKPRKAKPNQRIYQSWYNDQCELLRNRIRRAGEATSKDPFNEQKQMELANAKREYNRLIK